MRPTPIIVALLLLVPLASSLGLPPAVPRAPLLPADLSDGDLMRLLAPFMGLEPTRLQLAHAPVGESFDTILPRLAARAGSTLDPSDVTDFKALDPQLAAPVLTLLVAVERSWDLIDTATSHLSDAQRVEIALLAHADPTDPRVVALVGQSDLQMLFDAGLLVTDTVETLVLPQLQAAAAAGVWPANPIADPIGVLRIGGTGNDVESLNRIVQIDARGDDTYTNNAGATTILNFLFGQGSPTMQTPVSVSIDLSGNDTYTMNRPVPSQGGSLLSLGFGLMLDLQGDDTYFGSTASQGGSFGLHRDYSGNDEHVGGGISIGAGFVLVGIMRDDAGDDYYRAADSAAGFSAGPDAIGLLWDRAGSDTYATPSPAESFARFGWGVGGGHGWLVDEGLEMDLYHTETSTNPNGRHACNDCRWTMGSGGPDGKVRGFGNDNRGGLGSVLFQQELQ